VSLTTALEREIESLILSGELPPGERINEIHLAKRFGTSRAPSAKRPAVSKARGWSR
jgi:DNA-binding GntR family transcriptional regulator